MRRVLFVPVVALAWLASVPGVAFAQSIAGVVRDTTGAVLPGVTVEASSPALIERVRVAATSGTGQYRIIDLRPGTYTVTFTLAGFNTVVREGIVLQSDFTASVDVEMRVGAVEETVTVSAEAPTVDVQTSQRRQVLSSDLVGALPTGRNFQTATNLLPAVTVSGFDVGGSGAMWNPGSANVHGSQSRDSRVLIDGMVADAMFPTGQCSCIYDNEAQTEEFSVNVSGGSAEAQTAGVQINRIPRQGGNQFSGEFLGLWGNDGLQGQNADADLRARGLTAPAQLSKLYDINYMLGGPIVRDKLWFFFSGRHWAYNNFIASVFNPDGSQAVDDNDLKAFPLRLTYQADRKNKFTFLYDWTSKNRGNRDLDANTEPKASVVQTTPQAYIAQAKWTMTASNRVLIEAGFTQNLFSYTLSYQPEVERATCFTAFALCPPGTSYGDIRGQDLARGTSWNAAPQDFVNPFMSRVAVASASYVTGAHSFKAGIQHRWGWQRATRTVNGDLVQRYRNGVPDSVQIRNTPIVSQTDVNGDFGFYVQDTWTIDRLTINPGLRVDYFNGEVPAQSLGSGRFVPAREFARIPNLPDWTDLSPRLGMAYDLFGGGRTALKFHWGRYVQSEGPGFADNYNPAVFDSDVRTWNDLNKDNIAQENELGPTTNVNFGVRATRNPDPDIERPYQRVTNVAIEHELMRGVGVSVSYNRRTYHQTFWTDNLKTTHADYTLVEIPDPRSNGQLLPVYNLSSAKLGLVDQLDTNSDRNTQTYNGVDVTFSVRFPNRATLFGGTSTGRVVNVTCQVDNPNALRFCDQREFDIPFITQFKLSGTYQLPYGVQVSGSFRSQLGSERSINYSVGRAQIRNLTVASVNVRLNEPGSSFNDRVNQLDLSVTRSFQSRGVVVRPEVGLFNILNTNPVINQVNTFGARLNEVVTILDPRLVRLGVTVRF